MKRFHIVTEADARVLEYGSTIALAAGGHVTPLAQDTLRARRVTVIADVADADVAALAPPASIRTVALAGDHTSPTPGWMEGALQSAERVVKEVTAS